ncbi:MAG: sensor histidine kinase [Candidatus Omnitrophota bacterium]
MLKPKKYQILTFFLIVFFFPSHLAPHTGEAAISGDAKYCLSPVSRFHPLVSIERSNGKFFIRENLEEKTFLSASSTFKEDAAFLYLNQLISHAINKFNGKISASLLKQLIEKHLSHIDFMYFRWEEIYTEGHSFFLPFKDPESGRELLLHFFQVKKNGKKANSFPVTAFSCPIDGATVTFDVFSPDIIFAEQDDKKTHASRTTKKQNITSAQNIYTPEKEKIQKRLLRLRRVQINSKGSLSDNDMAFLTSLREYYNLPPVSGYGPEQSLSVLTGALIFLTKSELASLAYKDDALNPAAALEEIGTSCFRHELQHIANDCPVPEAILLACPLLEGSEIYEQLNYFAADFGHKYIESHAQWLMILRNIKQIVITNPRLVAGILDTLLSYIEEIQGKRAEIEKYLLKYKMQIDPVLIDFFLENITRGKIACDDNIMVLSRLKQDILFPVRDISIDINSSIQSALVPYESSEKIELRVQLDPDIPAIYGNPARIHYIWTNLFRNSSESISEALSQKKNVPVKTASLSRSSYRLPEDIKTTPHRSGKGIRLLSPPIALHREKGIIDVKTRRVNYMGKIGIEITVSDNGAGIKDGVNIFGEGISTKEHGTGLGLSIVKKTVRDLGGEISFTSPCDGISGIPPGRGATFTIRLPATDKTAAPRRIDDDISGQHDEIYAPDITEENRHAAELVETLKMAEIEASYEKTEQDKTRHRIIALDTSWIPSGTQGIQDLVNEIRRMSSPENGFENISFVRGKGGDLYENIFDRIEQIEKTKNIKIDLSDILIIGGKDTLSLRKFSNMKSTDTVKRSFMISVDPSHINENNYIRLVRMLTAAVRLHKGEISSVNIPGLKANKTGPDLWDFIPEISPEKIGGFAEIYKSQKEIISSL